MDERGKWYIKSKYYYSFGSSLHRALQRFHDSGDTGVTDAQTAIAALEETWIDAGYRSPQEMQEALGDGKRLLEKYVIEADKNIGEAEVLFVEKRLRLDMGDFVIQGIVDRLDKLPDGRLRVVDYKSGRQSVSSEEIVNDIAMCTYQLMASELFPEYTSVEMSIIALRTLDQAFAEMDPSELTQFKQDILTLGTEIINRDYETMEPVPKELCHDCDFLKLCQKHPDFRANYQPAEENIVAES